MGILEYRDDDIIGGGFCPKCGRSLRDVSRSGQGWCELHQWVFADFEQRFPDPEEEEDVREPDQ